MYTLPSTILIKKFNERTRSLGGIPSGIISCNIAPINDRPQLTFSIWSSAIDASTQLVRVYKSEYSFSSTTPPSPPLTSGTRGSVSIILDLSMAILVLDSGHCTVSFSSEERSSPPLSLSLDHFYSSCCYLKTTDILQILILRWVVCGSHFSLSNSRLMKTTLLCRRNKHLWADSASRLVK